MDCPAAAPHADPHAAAGPSASVVAQRPHYPHPYGYPYPDAAYYHPGPTVDPSAYHYPRTTTAPAEAAVAAYAPYQYYGAQPAGAGGNLADYYFSAGEVSHAPAAQADPAAAGREAVKHFGFNPQQYMQVAAMKAPNGMAPAAAATGIHHAQWNAHFGHPHPQTKNVIRKYVKKKPNIAQPATCEVCKIQCDTLDVLRIHKTGKKHKKNLEKLQESITPKPAKTLNNAVGADAAPSASADDVVPALPATKRKKNKSSAATPEALEVKKRRVLEAGAAQDEVKTCTTCNVVVNSQKVYEFHIAGHKHKAMVQKQQQGQLAHVA